MIVSSVPGLPLIPDASAPASCPEVAGGVPVSDFALLLPGNAGGGSSPSTEEPEIPREASEAEAEETPAEGGETEPNLAEQTNLAALLYTWPFPPNPPAPTPADEPAVPAITGEAPQEARESATGTADSLPTGNELPVRSSGARAFALDQRKTTSAQPAKDAAWHEPKAGQATPAIPATPASSATPATPAVPATAAPHTAHAPLAEGAEADTEPVPVAANNANGDLLPQAASPANPQAGSAAEPTATITEPASIATVPATATAEPGETTPTRAGSPEPANETAPTAAQTAAPGSAATSARLAVQEYGHPSAPSAKPGLAGWKNVRRPQTAEVAAPVAATQTPLKASPVNSAPTPADLPSVQASANSAPAANPDGYLIPGQSSLAKKARGTASAKGVRDMIEPSANPLNSKPDPRAARTGAASLTAPAMGPEKETRGGVQGDAQDQAASGRPELNSSNSDPFSISAPGATLTSHSAKIGEVFKTAESKPMNMAAVIEEIGHGLDHLQQHGQNRVDMRLTLEGGGEVSIQLQVRDGAVHASFQTGSAELREALQQGWSQMASRSEQAGLSLAPPVFKSPETGSFTAGQQSFREQRQDPSQEQDPRPSTFYPAPHQTKRPAATATAGPRTSGGLNLWA